MGIWVGGGESRFGSSPMAGFGISAVKPAGSATMYLEYKFNKQDVELKLHSRSIRKV